MREFYSLQSEDLNGEEQQRKHQLLTKKVEGLMILSIWPGDLYTLQAIVHSAIPLLEF